eukprot:10516113-Ditylum_brightwellii.AAC.1
MNDFPQPTVPKVPGEPSYDTTRIIHTRLQDKAASINSNEGGGAHKHLTFVLISGQYQQVTCNVFAYPVHPVTISQNTRAFPLQQDLQASKDNCFVA